MSTKSLGILSRCERAAMVALGVWSLSACQTPQSDQPATNSPQFGKPVTTQVCTAAARKCTDLGTEAECLADGSGWRTTACQSDHACEDGQCRPVVCKPGSKQCDGGQVVTCGSRGVSWTQRSDCASGQVCVAGACVAPTCTAGGTQCTGNAVATCTADGSGWTSVACASDESCAADPQSGEATCQTQICAPGAATCKGGRVLTCDANGLQQAITHDCVASGQLCLDGACVDKQCDPGALGCDGLQVAVCAGEGAQWSITACPTGQACDNGACAKVVCAASEVFCDGNQVAVCNDSGTAATVQETCSGKQVCKQGSCQAQAVVCGDGLCDGDEPKTCAGDCKPITIIAPDFDRIPLGVSTTLPAVPRPQANLPLPAWTAGKAIQMWGKTLLVADTDNGALVRLDKQTLQVTSIVGVGSRPEQLVVNAQGTAFVPSRDGGTVAVVPWSADKPTAWFKPGIEPYGVALSADGQVLYVSLAGEGAVVRLDAATGKELDRAVTGLRPKALAVHPSGNVFVTLGTGAVTVLQPSHFKVATLGPLQPVASVNLRTANPVPVCQGEATQKVRIAHRAVSLTIDPDTGNVLIPHTLIASGSGPEVLASVGIKPPEKPQEFVTVCSGGYGSTCSQVPKPPPPGEPPCSGTPLRPYELSVSKLSPSGAMLPTAQGQPVVDLSSGRSMLARWDQPVEAVMHPTASLLLVAAKGTNSVAVFNSAAADPMQWPLADIKVGDGPKALVVSPNGQTLYVLNGTGFSVSAVDLTPLLQLVSGSASTPPQQLAKVTPLYMKANQTTVFATDPLPEQARLGRKVFHYANNARLSVANRFACATCHIDGTEDKQVWFIAEGARQTPALAGRLADTPPYNWLGTKGTLQENITGTTARMGGSGLLPAELESLAQFIAVGLKPPPNPHVGATGLTPQQQNGKKLFMDAATKCNTCHVGGGGSDGAQHDVGTMTEVEAKVAKATGHTLPILYNTPSLRGLFYSAPYLHDGSAPTLHDALKKTAHTMGKTAHLTAQELDDLVAYLLTL
jgi:YVTN family beta-propeller protein